MTKTSDRVFARLGSADHVLPQPDRDYAPFPMEGRFVNMAVPFWRRCMADGSIIEGAPPSAAKPAPNDDAAPAAKSGRKEGRS